MNIPFPTIPLIDDPVYNKSIELTSPEEQKLYDLTKEIEDLEMMLADKEEEIKARTRRGESVPITEYDIRNELKNQARRLRADQNLLDLEVQINQITKKLDEIRASGKKPTDNDYYGLTRLRERRDRLRADIEMSKPYKPTLNPENLAREAERRKAQEEAVAAAQKKNEEEGKYTPGHPNFDYQAYYHRMRGGATHKRRKRVKRRSLRKFLYRSY